MAYGYYRSLTIDHTKCGASAPGATFPVLVKITGATSVKTVANGGNVQNTGTQTGGVGGTIPYDLVFSSDSAGNTLYAWEVEFYDGTAGDLWAWVTGPVVPASGGSDFVFYMAYGDSGVSTQQNTGASAPSAVWDSNYKGVWHLTNGTTLNLIESTGVNNGTNHSATAATGKVQGGVSFVAASSQYFDVGSDASLNITGDITVEFWVNPTTTATQLLFTRLVSGPGNGYTAFVNVGGASAHFAFYFDVQNAGVEKFALPSSTLATGSWTHVVGILSGTTVSLRINGAEPAYDSGSARTGASIGSTSVTATVGRDSRAASYYGNGLMDEIRVSNVARSTAWILTEYNNQNLPGNIGTAGFLTFGAETANSGSTSYLVSDTNTLSDAQILNLWFGATLSETETLSDSIGASSTYDATLSDTNSLSDQPGFGPGYLFQGDQISETDLIVARLSGLSRPPVWHLQAGLSKGLLDGN